MSLLPNVLRFQSISRRFFRLGSGPASTITRPLSSLQRLPIDMETVHTTERLNNLRRFMKEHKVNVYSKIPH